MEDNKELFISPELKSILNTTRFLASIIGQTKDVKIISNVYKDYATELVETFSTGPKEMVYNCYTKSEDMVPENDVHIISANNSHPITFDAVMDVLNKIIHQVKNVDERNVIAATDCTGFKFNSELNAYELGWY